nr:hypothetical protein [Tanacetum cinerariifolium]
YSIYTVKRVIADVAASFQRSQIHNNKLSMSNHYLGRFISSISVGTIFIYLLLLLLSYLRTSTLASGYPWCKKQTVVATSSTEAEYVATASGYAQFWNTVTVKQSADVTRLQALVDKKKVMISKAVIHDVLRLDDAEGVDCLPNEDIFTRLARMGYEKPSTKLTFYKAFFSSQWKFLIHTILQKFNFSKYIFDSLVKNVDSSSKFYMYPRFIQLIVQNQLGDLSIHTTKYISPALTQKVFANMRRVRKGFSRVETPLFEGMLVIQENVVEAQLIPSPAPPTSPPPPQDIPSTSHEALDACATLTRRVEHLEHDKVAQDLEITKLKMRVKKLERFNKVKPLKLRRLRKVGTFQRIESSDDTIMEDVINQGRMIDELDRDDGIELMGEKEEKKKDIANDDQAKGRYAEIQVEKQAEIYQIDMDHAAKVLISAASTIILAAEPNIPTVTITAAPVKVAAAFTKWRRGVVIRDPEEESTVITPAETKDKGKELNQDIDWDVAIEHVKEKAKEDLFIQRYQVMKKRPQTEAQARRNMIMYLKNTVGFKLDYFKRKSYDDIRPIFEAKFNTNMEFLLKLKDQIEEEENRALESINETPAHKAAKKRRLNKEDEDVEEIKQHLEIVPDEDDDVYTHANPLARKVPVVDYQIIHLNNKPCYKIIRVDETHRLYVSFITLLKKFYREDLESLWSIVKERFSTSKPNNFSDEYLLTTLRTMFGRPDGQDNVWKSQRTLELMLPRSLKKNTKCVNAAGEELSVVKHKLMLLDTAAKRSLYCQCYKDAAKLKLKPLMKSAATAGSSEEITK